MRHALAVVVLFGFAACGGGGAAGGGADAGALPDAAGDPFADALDPLACTGGVVCGGECCLSDGNECVDDQCKPACDSGVRCGATLDVCCDAGTVCLEGACIAPGAACGDSYDCEPGQFCEPTLLACLPQPDPLTCELPAFDALEPMLEWSYTGGEVISIPVVADLDGDNHPEMVVNLAHVGGDWPIGQIVILDGRTGVPKVGPIAHAPASGTYGSHGRSTIALGDVSGDGLPDVVYAARPTGGKSPIVAIDGTGALLWTSHDAAGAAYDLAVDNGGATLANLDADPMAEIAFGATLLDHDGRVLWDAGTAGSGASYGAESSYKGGISAFADLDGDGAPELISGKHAWKIALAGDPVVATVTPYWTYAGDDGYPAIADLDADGRPEVVLVASGFVIVLDGRTGLLWCGIDATGAACDADGTRRTPRLGIPSGGRGGPPTIADFDGDGRPEIGVAGGSSYSVYDLARPGEDTGTSTPAPGALFVRWSAATQDLSSNSTGSSVFDFQGDGASEVIYADECKMRVYGGAVGDIQLELPNTTATIHEYPLVVDADGDGNSEIVVVANQTSSGSNCPGVTPRQGIYVYGDAHDRWVPTRRVWTQHSYHVSNATSAGNVPLVEEPAWSTTNSYRQNVQGEGVFNAPDLSVSLSFSKATCSIHQVELRARVQNLGALGVPAGVTVEFRLRDGSGSLVGTATTAVSLLPGQATTVPLRIDSPRTTTTYAAFVDGVDGASSEVGECDEDNNGATVDVSPCVSID